MTAMNKELEEEEGSLVVIAEPGTTVAKIQSRLLSSKFLSMQVAASLEALKVLLNPALKQNVSENNNPHAPSSSDKVIERPSKLQKELPILHASTEKTPSRLDNSNQTANIDMDGWESGSINEDGVEESDDGWESGDIGPNDDSQDGDLASNQESESKNYETNAETTKSKKSSKAGKTVKSLSSKNVSTFLPSLSVGFVRGGSDDSEWSETEDKGTDLEPKKNRRGQRARRA